MRQLNTGLKKKTKEEKFKIRQEKMRKKLLIKKSMQGLLQRDIYLVLGNRQ
jgi:hypothetical protein